jgi:hypothetical protein
VNPIDSENMLSGHRVCKNPRIESRLSYTASVWLVVTGYCVDPMINTFEGTDYPLRRAGWSLTGLTENACTVTGQTPVTFAFFVLCAGKSFISRRLVIDMTWEISKNFGQTVHPVQCNAKLSGISRDGT